MLHLGESKHDAAFRAAATQFHAQLCQRLWTTHGWEYVYDNGHEFMMLTSFDEPPIPDVLLPYTEKKTYALRVLIGAKLSRHAHDHGMTSTVRSLFHNKTDLSFDLTDTIKQHPRFADRLADPAMHMKMLASRSPEVLRDIMKTPYWKGIVVHEYTHFLDSMRSRKLTSTERMASHLEYHLNPAEFNAYFQSIVNNYVEYVMSGYESQAKQRLGRNPKEFVDNIVSYVGFELPDQRNMTSGGSYAADSQFLSTYLSDVVTAKAPAPVRKKALEFRRRFMKRAAMTWADLRMRLNGVDPELVVDPLDVTQARVKAMKKTRPVRAIAATKY